MAERGSPTEVFRIFLRLGLTSFGGPIAHIGYFRQEFVARRAWLDEAAFADLVGLCQFLPGPASSQVGFAIGLMRAGYAGGLAAWTGFTLPSAIMLTFLALGAGKLQGGIAGGVVHGLKLVAVAIVAQAVWGMARTLCPDRTRAAMAAAAAACVLVAGTSFQVAAIAAGAVIGLVLCRNPAAVGDITLPIPISRRAGAGALIVFFFLLLALPTLGGTGQTAALFEAFYRSGALVFGGGHVVLPLLHAAVVTPGWVTEDGFLAGYGAAQAMPGPLFTLAAYLGAVAGPAPNGIAGAVVALLAIFLPGILILVGTVPFWAGLRRLPSAQAAMRGVNAAVVGVLGAALYDPVWTSAVATPADFALALIGFVLLTAWQAPPLAVVLLGSAAGGMLAAG